MAQLIFHVENQYIHRLDEFHVVARSNHYLYAEFTFTDDWVGEKTALFSVEADNGETITKPMLIGADGTCEVPHEVLEYDNSQLEVSAFCGNRVTANVAVVPVHESGYNNDSAPDDPTPDVYTQILNRLANVEQIVVDKATEAESWAVGGTDTREGEDTDNSKYYSEQSSSSATEAATSASNASDSASTASSAATQATESEATATQKASEVAEAKADIDNTYAGMQELETRVGNLADHTEEKAQEAGEASDQARGYAEAASLSERNATSSARDAAAAAATVTSSVRQAAGYANNAQNYASAADRSMQSAATSERNAAQSSTNAATYASNAEESATNSALSASDSNGYAGAALQSANEALEAQTASESARDDAVAAKNVAETMAQDIQSSAQQIATNTQNIATNTAQIAQNTSDITDVKDKKVDKVSGKGLSTNDYTNADKTKLNGIDNGAQVNRTYNVVTGKPTGNAAPGFGDTVIVSQISQSAIGQVSATDRTITIPNTVATTSREGLMSAADKAKIANLETRLAALETLIANKQNTVISMTDENNNVTEVTVLAE